MRALGAYLIAFVIVGCAPAPATAPLTPTPDIKRGDLFYAYSEFVTVHQAKLTSREILGGALGGVTALVRARGGDGNVAIPTFADSADVVDADFQAFSRTLTALAAKNPSITGDALADAAIDGMVAVRPDCHTGYWRTLDESPWKRIVTAGRQGDGVVTDRLLDGGIGYVAWDVWIEPTPAQLRPHLDRLVGAGARAWLFDLRGNPGGQPKALETISSWFLNGEPLYTMQWRDATATSTADPSLRLPAAYQLPIDVVIDEGSTSASEFFSLALKANGRASLVGEHTKGCFGAFNLYLQRGMLAITVGIGFGPHGEPHNGVGLTPDIVAPSASAVEAAAAHLRTLATGR